MHQRAYGTTQLESEVPGTMRFPRGSLAVLVLKVRSPQSPEAYGDSQPEAVWQLFFGFRPFFISLKGFGGGGTDTPYSTFVSIPGFRDFVWGSCFKFLLGQYSVDF